MQKFAASKKLHPRAQVRKKWHPKTVFGELLQQDDAPPARAFSTDTPFRVTIFDFGSEGQEGCDHSQILVSHLFHQRRGNFSWFESQLACTEVGIDRPNVHCRQVRNPELPWFIEQQNIAVVAQDVSQDSGAGPSTSDDEADVKINIVQGVAGDARHRAVPLCWAWW
mmetsp:Transcript_23411/g.49930  ORF Transcript_23411/g.49930 Transcript_23411/m.49930 type:complete len:167 (-) Transcript_23411:68-568(-)